MSEKDERRRRRGLLPVVCWSVGWLALTGGAAAAVAGAGVVAVWLLSGGVAALGLGGLRLLGVLLWHGIETADEAAHAPPPGQEPPPRRRIEVRPP